MKTIGIDIEEVSRFSNKKIEKEKKFYKKIFTDLEIEYCLKKSNPYPHFTARFCAKEAVLKTINQPEKFTDIEVRMKNKKPQIFLKGSPFGMISISHTKNYAVAFFITEK